MQGKLAGKGQNEPVCVDVCLRKLALSRGLAARATGRAGACTASGPHTQRGSGSGVGLGIYIFNKHHLGPCGSGPS